MSPSQYTNYLSTINPKVLVSLNNYNLVPLALSAPSSLAPHPSTILFCPQQYTGVHVYVRGLSPRYLYAMPPQKPTLLQASCLIVLQLP